MSRPGPVVVVGDVATDVVVRPRTAPAPGSDAPAEIVSTGGGAGGNVAWWLAGAGVDVRLVASVGHDEAGRARRAELRAAGVDVRDLHVTPGAATGTVVVLVAPDGERTMFPDRGANRMLSVAHVDAALERAARDRAAHLHLSGYALLDDGSRPAAVHALTRARTLGLSVSVDPSSAGPLEAAGPERFRAWTRDCDLLLPNLAEARLLSGVDQPEHCARRLADAYPQVVVTLGADGAVFADAEGLWRASGPSVRVVDTTGAGDAFTAGVLASWLAGASPADALAGGTALAARAVGVAGARPRTPA